MMQNFDKMIQEKADRVFTAMGERVSREDVTRIQEAFELARIAHAGQKRKSGEPYIFHPIAVADIVAGELMLGANPVIAAFLHDVVEDTDYTIGEIRERFGEDVAFLVRVVTKPEKESYEMSKQMDNYKQMLDSIQYDIRALQITAVDRLHLLSDIVNCITHDLQLSIDALTTKTVDGIVNCNISFKVHSFGELQTIMSQLSAIDRIDEVRRV